MQTFTRNGCFVDGKNNGLGTTYGGFHSLSMHEFGDKKIGKGVYLMRYRFDVIAPFVRDKGGTKFSRPY